jgi:hypothetical protein
MPETSGTAAPRHRESAESSTSGFSTPRRRGAGRRPGNTKIFFRGIPRLTAKARRRKDESSLSPTPRRRDAGRRPGNTKVLFHASMSHRNDGKTQRRKLPRGSYSHQRRGAGAPGEHREYQDPFRVLPCLTATTRRRRWKAPPRIYSLEQTHLTRHRGIPALNFQTRSRKLAYTCGRFDAVATIRPASARLLHQTHVSCSSAHFPVQFRWALVSITRSRATRSGELWMR